MHIIYGFKSSIFSISPREFWNDLFLWEANETHDKISERLVKVNYLLILNPDLNLLLWNDAFQFH